MVTVYLDVDEWYPVYSITEDKRFYSSEVQVGEETLERWKAAAQAFDDVQNEMAEAAKAQDKRL